MNGVRRFLRARSGVASAEFAMVVPLLLLLIFGIIDSGRLLWTWNQAEKATQMGVRYAAVTDMAAGGLADYNFMDDGVPQGTPVPTSAFGKIQCSNTGCTCPTAPCPSLTPDATAFANIVARMQVINSTITAGDVLIDYENVGLGFAGNPNGPDIAPLVTVQLRNMTFQPIVLTLFAASIPLPAFSAALTMEDGAGAASN